MSLTPTYKCSSKGKEDTLLAMSQKTPDGEQFNEPSEIKIVSFIS